MLGKLLVVCAVVLAVAGGKKQLHHPESVGESEVLATEDVTALSGVDIASLSSKD